jgi:hypothetical protein
MEICISDQVMKIHAVPHVVETVLSLNITSIVLRAIVDSLSQLLLALQVLYAL